MTGRPVDQHPVRTLLLFAMAVAVAVALTVVLVLAVYYSRGGFAITGAGNLVVDSR